MPDPHWAYRITPALAWLDGCRPVEAGNAEETGNAQRKGSKGFTVYRSGKEYAVHLTLDGEAVRVVLCNPYRQLWPLRNTRSRAVKRGPPGPTVRAVIEAAQMQQKGTNR